MADVEREDPTFAHRESSEQIQRYGREAEPSGDAGQDGQDERHRTDLEEHRGGVAGRRGNYHDSSTDRSRCRPSGVPMVTATSPLANATSGAGAAMVSPSRMMATIDAPVF